MHVKNLVFGMLRKKDGCFFTAYQPFFGSFNAELNLLLKKIKYTFCLQTVVQTVLFQTIQFCISIEFQCQKQSYFKQFSLEKVQTVLFQTVQFSINTQITSIWSIDKTLLGATTSGQSGPGCDGNEGVLCIPQSSSMTGTLPSDCLVSYQDTRWRILTPLQRSSRCILQPQPTGQEKETDWQTEKSGGESESMSEKIKEWESKRKRKRDNEKERERR